MISLSQAIERIVAEMECLRPIDRELTEIALNEFVQLDSDEVTALLSVLLSFQKTVSTSPLDAVEKSRTPGISGSSELVAFLAGRKDWARGNYKNPFADASTESVCWLDGFNVAAERASFHAQAAANKAKLAAKHAMAQFGAM